MGLTISVWGKNGSGKSTVASNLACVFAKKGMQTALVGANRFYGSIQYCFNMEVRAEQSLRAVLTGGDSLSVNEYFQECPAVRNLHIASLSDIDDCAGYRKMRVDAITRFISLTQKSFAVVLFDCDESTEDPFSMYCLTLSDSVIFVTRPTLQSAVFAKAYEPIVSGLRLNERLTTILINDNAAIGGSASDNFLYVPFGGEGHCRVLPYCKEIGNSRGGLPPIILSHNVNRASARYRKEIHSLADALANPSSP